MNQAAYILTSTNVDDRVTDATALASRLEVLDVFDRVEMVPAIFWHDEAAVARFLSKHPEHSFQNDYLEEALQGQICCTLSHIAIWRQLLDSEYDGAMILEDDIYVSDEDEFKATLAKLREHPEVDWLRFHLHKDFREGMLDDSSPLAFVADPSKWGFATYWISRAGAEKLVAEFRDIANNVDIIIPVLGREQRLNVKAINKAIVEHHKFEGDRQILLTRHPREQRETKIQRRVSTIYSSPALTSSDALHHFLTTLDNLQELRRDGITVLKGVFDPKTIDLARDQVMNNWALYKNTRPTPSSRHLASFHRYPQLQSLHSLLAGNPKVLDFIKLILGGQQARSIGLSDITVNRSQGWHKDLLRGKYQHYQNGLDIWGEECGGVYKLLMYLQDGTSLNIIRGSHRVPVSLDKDEHAEPEDDAAVTGVSVKAGDVVVMDIRTSHRGSSEEVFLSGAYDNDPKILVSTALGLRGGKLTDAMEFGNARRLLEWQERYRDSDPIS